MNWIDWIIVIVVIFYLVDGWETGLVHLISNLASFLGALFLAIKFHSVVGIFLIDKLGIPSMWTNVLGYIVVAFISQILLSLLFLSLASNIPKKVFTSKINRILGAALSLLNSLVLIAFMLLLTLALPLRGTIKSDIKDSVLASAIVKVAERYGGQVRSELDQVTKEAMRFLTVQPKSTERIPLTVSPTQSELSIDNEAEEEMVRLVNNERQKAGVGILRIDTSMIGVARKHSRDMFERQYFSHIDPNGHDAAYRMEQDKVFYTIVGENLAYAPTTDVAMKGLMDSEGHRRNILDPQFTRIGIGVIDAGIYGKMYTQLFAD